MINVSIMITVRRDKETREHNACKIYSQLASGEELYKKAQSVDVSHSQGSFESGKACHT